jgi:putative ABC transport system permease protein
MWNVTIKGLRSHALRLVLTGLAVVLGVAFVSGTLMLTDSMRAAFDDVITSTAGGLDLQLRGETAFSSTTSVVEERAPIPPELLARVAEVEGVRLAEGVVQGSAQLVATDGTPIGGGGAPTIGANAPSEEGLGGVTLDEGSLPSSSGQMAIDAATAAAQELSVGDQVTVVTPRGPESVSLTGIIRFGESGNLAGATVVLFDAETALDRFSPDGGWSNAELYTVEDADRAAVAEAVEAVAGSGYEVITAEELVDETLEAIGGFLDVFATALLVFAGVSLFVGAFIIFNTFSIIVAQRTREFALLRAVGASRRQVLVAMLTEAALTGLVASVIGVGLGAVIALGMTALLGAVGLELPSSGLVFSVRTAVVGVVVGTLVTSVSALVPVLRSTRVPPIAALQAVAAPPAPRAGAARYVIGGLVTAVGVAALVVGLFADGGVTVVGIGAAVVFLGITILSPLVARPVVRLLGAPVAAGFGVHGQLARENAMRNPRRTASTAAALMIGLGLVGFVTIFAASLKASAGVAVDELFAADVQVRSSTFTDLPAGLTEQLAALPEVALAGAQEITDIRVGERSGFVVAMDPATMDDLFVLGMDVGSTEALAEGGLLMTTSLAEAGGWEIGDEVPVTFALTGTTRLVLRGTFSGAGDVSYVIDDATYAEHVRTRRLFSVLVAFADGVDPAAGRAAVESALADQPTTMVMDREGFREEIEGQVNQLLGLVFGLLGLSVVIALFGIVNTLALSVFERVRELGLLRAIGMTRRQVRAMVRWEAVLIAVLGALLGLGVGVFFAWILAEALAEQLTAFVIPYGQLAVAVVVAALAGVLAGVMPARRAAKVDMLQAITAE